MTHRVLCTYVNDPHPSIARYARETEFVKIDTDDDFHYWREINERFKGEDDLVIIEPDIEITTYTIPSLVNCSHHWCCFAYDIAGAEISFGLGCTKYSAEAQALLTGNGSIDIPRERWQRMDLKLMTAFDQIKGITGIEHVHGRVAHHHDYDNLEFEVGFLYRLGSKITAQEVTERNIAKLKQIHGRR